MAHHFVDGAFRPYAHLLNEVLRMLGGGVRALESLALGAILEPAFIGWRERCPGGVQSGVFECEPRRAAWLMCFLCTAGAGSWVPPPTGPERMPLSRRSGASGSPVRWHPSGFAAISLRTEPLPLVGYGPAPRTPRGRSRARSAFLLRSMHWHQSSLQLEPRPLPTPARPHAARAASDQRRDDLHLVLLRCHVRSYAPRDHPAIRRTERFGVG